AAGRRGAADQADDRRRRVLRDLSLRRGSRRARPCRPDQDGWKIAMTVFGFERGGLAQAARFERVVAELAALARERGVGGDATTRQKIAQAQIEAHVFRLIGLRNLTKAQHGHAPGPEASVTKLYWSAMDKRMQETAIGVEGMYGALAPESAMAIEDGRWQYGW